VSVTTFRRLAAGGLVEPVEVSLPEALALRRRLMDFQIFLWMLLKLIPAAFRTEKIRPAVEVGRSSRFLGIHPHAADRVHVRLFGLLQVHFPPPIVGTNAEQTMPPRFYRVVWCALLRVCLHATSLRHDFNFVSLARIFHELHSFICKAFRGAAVLGVPQAPDNAANGRMRLAQRVNIFEHCFTGSLSTKCTSKFLRRISINPLILCIFSALLKKLNEICGLEHFYNACHARGQSESKSNVTEPNNSFRAGYKRCQGFDRPRTGENRW
jgi:hypothetical protein